MVVDRSTLTPFTRHLDWYTVALISHFRAQSIFGSLSVVGQWGESKRRHVTCSFESIDTLRWYLNFPSGRRYRWYRIFVIGPSLVITSFCPTFFRFTPRWLNWKEGLLVDCSLLSGDDVAPASFHRFMAEHKLFCLPRYRLPRI